MEELARDIERAAGDGLAVAPWGGGTQIGFGNPPRRLDVVLRTSRLDQVIDYSPEDLTITVQAGITLAALQQALAEHGQHVAIEAPLPEQATIGGILAAGGDGPRRFSYGNRREQLIGIRVAHPDGTVTKAGGKVVKNVTGYEMTKLYTGSLGTLGVIVEASFKLRPLPTARATLVGTCDSLETAVALVPRLLAAHLQPLAVDTLNGEALGQIISKATEGWALALEFGGSQAAVDRQMKDARAIVKEAGLQEMRVPASFWPSVRDFGRVSGGVIVRATTLSSHLPEVAAEAGDAAVIAHAGNGILYAFWDPDESSAARVRRIRAVSHRLGGSTVVEDCPLDLKSTVDVWGPEPSGFEVMRRLKEQFDPQGVLNPGRFIGGI